MTTLLSVRLPSLLLAGLFCACVPLRPANADKNEDKKRALLRNMRRVAIVPIFFGTETLNKLSKSVVEAAQKDANGKGADDTRSDNSAAPEDTAKKAGTDTPQESSVSKPKGKASDPAEISRQRSYARDLLLLETDARAYLPQRLAKRAVVDIVPPEEVTAALKTIERTPETMFLNNGRIKSSKFPLPDPEAVKKLAQTLHADAIVLGVLDEPRRTDGKYYYDFLSGFNYDTAHVQTHGGFYLSLPDGSEALHGYMSVKNPVSRVGNRSYVLADWIDAQQLMLENLLDEWTYYTPRKG